MRRFLCLGLALSAFQGSAWAVDNEPIIQPAPTSGLSGYVDVHVGYGWGDENGTFDDGAFSYEESWSEADFGGAGRGVVPLSPSLSLQLDVWTNTFTGTSSGEDTEDGPFEYDFTGNYPGVGGHLTYHTPDGHRLGVLASVGADDSYGAFVNVGAEAVHNYGNWRLYGQTGFVFAVSDEAADDNAKNWYGHGVLAYYFNPNLAVSGNLGYDSYSNNHVDGSVWFWGARVEYKPPTMPLTGYVAFEGWNASATHITDPSSSNEYAILVGTRLLLNQQTIQGADMAVGLMDMNGIFGDPFAH